MHLNVGGSVQLTATGSSGGIVWSTTDTAVATVVFGKVTGVGSGTATIRAINGSNQATARVTVTRGAAIELSAANLTFTGVSTAALPDSQTVDVTDAGEDPLTGLAVDSITFGPGAANWLNATLLQADAPTQLVLRPNTSALAPGSYTALVSISSPTAAGGPQFITVRFTLLHPAAITLGTNTATFSAQQSTALPTQQTILITDGGDVPLTGLGVGTVSYSAGATGWLAASVTSSSAPASLLLQPNTTSLATGDYTATVPVTSTLAGVAAQSVTVTYHVAPAPVPPVIVVNPTSLGFTAGRNAAIPATQSIAVGSTGTGTVTGLSASVTYSGASGWLGTPSFAGGVTTAPTTLNVQPTTTALPAGVYSATIHLSSTTPGVLTKDIPVTYIVNDLILSQTSIQFSTTSTALPLAQILDVSNAGSGSITGVTATVTLLSGRAAASWVWLSASIPSTITTSPSSLTLTVTRADSLGDFTALVTVAAPGMVSKTVNVTYRRQATMTNDILPILQSCAGGCHNAPATFNFNIGFGTAAQAMALVNPPATPGHTYVIVGDTINSNLVHILNASSLPSGYFAMPPSCPTSGCMDPQLRTRIYIWMLQGAIQ